jgi:hypothetical protein
MVLLSAHDYASDGGAILMKDSGVVLRLSPVEKKAMESFVLQFEVTKNLIVRNRTYEVVSKVDEALSSTATRYFNTKVHVSNSEERIMAMLLTGLSFSDIYAMVKNGAVQGLPRDISVQSLNTFERQYGRTPDVLQLAFPNLAGNVKGYMAPPKILTSVGQRVEADYFQCDFNKREMNGCAIAAYISVDVYSGYITGRLVKSMAQPVDRVRETVDIFRVHGHEIKLFAADQGILTQSVFCLQWKRIFTLRKYLMCVGKLIIMIMD